MKKLLFIPLFLCPIAAHAMDNNEAPSTSRAEKRKDAELLIQFCRYRKETDKPLSGDHHFIKTLNNLMLELFPQPQEKSCQEANPYDPTTQSKQYMDWIAAHFKEHIS